MASYHLLRIVTRDVRTIAAAALLLGSANALAQTQTIKPGEGQSLNALGHTWGFNKIQDDFTGFNVLKDGKPTSLHGIELTWDGKTLTLTDHHPYAFNPDTGRPWEPPQRTYNLTDRETGYASTTLEKETGSLQSLPERLKALLHRNPVAFESLRWILAKLRGE